MTDNSNRERPDMTSGALTSYKRDEQVKDNIDIVGRTRLPLLSLSGLDQTPFLPLLQEPAEHTTVPLRNHAEREFASPPSNTPFVPVLETPFTPAWYAAHNNNSAQPDATSYAIHNNNSIRPGAISPAGSVNKRTARRRPKWLFFLFIVLSCFFIFGLGTYIYFAHAAHPVLPKHTPPNNRLHSGAISPAMAGFSSEKGESFPVGGQSTLVIKGQKGNVGVTAGSTGTITVKASSNGRRADVINQSISANQSHDDKGHDVINITTAPGNISVDYTITMPADAQVKVEVDAGSISIAGVSGVNVDANSGSLNIENVSGPTNAYTTNGNITARKLKGPVVLESVNGSINADAVIGQLKAVTQNGDVVVREAMLNGQSALKTNYGSVRLSGSIDAHGTYTLSTHNGNVNLSLPGNTSFQMHTSTASGSINNEFGHNVVGHTPQANITISIIGGGSIAINKTV